MSDEASNMDFSPRLKQSIEELPGNFTLAEARKLAAAINGYWRGRGYEVQARVEMVGGLEGKSRSYFVRSNLVNGLPQRQEIKHAA